MKKIVLTGAAGRLGSYLREPLTQLADHLLTTEICFISKSSSYGSSCPT